MSQIDRLVPGGKKEGDCCLRIRHRRWSDEPCRNHRRLLASESLVTDGASGRGPDLWWARAAVSGGICADYETVRSVAYEVLRHRIITNFHARAQKVTPIEIIDKLLKDPSADGR